MAVFEQLQKQAGSLLPKTHAQLGELISIDGSLIDSVLSMDWADYRTGSKKAKLHLGFNINQGIRQKLFLTEGKLDERSFVHKIIEPGQTGVMDRGYQHPKNVDQLQTDKKHFVCRIKANTHKTCLEEYTVAVDSIVFYDARVYLGQAGENRHKNHFGSWAMLLTVQITGLLPAVLICQRKKFPICEEAPYNFLTGYC